MFYADLHVHSKYSRATGREADLEHYALWARRKGIGLVATGDFTHPAWRSELRSKLVPAEPGLFRLRDDIERDVTATLDPRLAAQAPGPTRFILEVEISTIYKRDGRTRKVHHLVLVPDLEQADRLTAALARVGNLASDGRPILGLDSRDLLDIVLESGPDAFLIPAHIWTPWFSALGSMSGFDAIADCYRDLASHVFAVETGLSSDPAMNWRVSSLDRYRLVSNSDAHSPSKLGREACVFDGPLSYAGLRQALATGQGFAGTLEFFPEEGKYHVDGHRKCGVRFEPEQTRAHQGRCPVCGNPLTVGVMNRVERLADRPEGARPEGSAPFRSLVPLPEVLGEMLRCGPDTAKAVAAYDAMLAALGPELAILCDMPLDTVSRLGSPMLAEAVGRMRRGQVLREPGYDGEYGVIRLFTADELAGGLGTGLLLEVPGAVRTRRQAPPPTSAAASKPAKPTRKASVAGSLAVVGLDADQKSAVRQAGGPLLIVAGPGTGKTRTLTSRLAWLVERNLANPEACLAITFTNRAAGEMRERLYALIPEHAARMAILTFHGLGYRIIRENAVRWGLGACVRVADEAETSALLMDRMGVPRRQAEDWLAAFSRYRHQGVAAPLDDQATWAFEVYRRELTASGLVDFDDLILLPAEWLEADAALVQEYRQRFPWVSVDEYQDVDAAQYRLLRHLVAPDGNVCVIGDPDQAIYGFRGGDVGFFQRFADDFPGARTVHLKHNYRSGRRILKAALRMIEPQSLVPDRVLRARADHDIKVTLHSAPSDRAEADFVVSTIEQLIGGSSFHALDSGLASGEAAEPAISFADIAVLTRTEAMADPVAEALERRGLPFHRRSHSAVARREAIQGILQAVAQGPVGAPLPQQVQAACESQRTALRGTGLTRALRRLAEQAGDFATFRSQLAMGQDTDLLDTRADAIKVLTLHAAKGLEFPVVFVIGCEDGILPLAWPGGGESDIAEERRLLFVGMTRAKRRLYLSHARRRLLWGTVRDMTPSPFLEAISSALARREHVRHRKPVRSEPLQMSLF